MNRMLNEPKNDQTSMDESLAAREKAGLAIDPALGLRDDAGHRFDGRLFLHHPDFSGGRLERVPRSENPGSLGSIAIMSISTSPDKLPSTDEILEPSEQIIEQKQIFKNLIGTADFQFERYTNRAHATLSEAFAPLNSTLKLPKG